MEVFSLNKEKIKHISKIISCVIVSLLIYTYVCIILAPKTLKDIGGKSYYAGQGFMAEPQNNSIDVMVFGNSDAYSAVKPIDIYNKYGYTSFVSGAPWQSMDVINTLLNKSIKKHSPKLVILEVDCLFEIKGTKTLNKIALLGSTYLYHSRWKELKSKDFYTYPSKKNKYDYNKGYVYSNKVVSVNPHKCKKSKKKKVSSKSKKSAKINRSQFNKFLDICKKNDIKVFLIYVPSPHSWNIKRHKAIQNLADEKNLKFIDFNILSENYQVDYNTDFRDRGDHLNCIGATRLTKYLGNYLNDNFSKLLKDRRKEKRLSYWNNPKYNTKLIKKIKTMS